MSNDNLTPEQRAQIDAEIFAGHKIQAIKLLRDATACDLLSAKNVVEAREAQLRASNPESFAPRKKAGCVGMLLVTIAVAGSVIAGLVHLCRA